MPSAHPGSTGIDARVSRRGFLRATAAGALSVSAGGLVTACGSGSSSASGSKHPGKPRHGGTLRAALSGGNSSDTLDPKNPINNVDYARVAQLYDSLVSFDSTGLPRLSLAEELSPNRDATAWTIRVRPGITFHNGKDLTAADVLYTLQRIIGPKSPGGGAVALSPLDIKRAKRLDKHTLRIPCTSPFSTFFETLAVYFYNVVPVGFDPKRPVGTGPFKYQSFLPGQQSTFTRYESYWQTGLPYADTLVITDYSDETSQVNALTGGQADLVDLLSTGSLASVRQGGATVAISNTGAVTPFTMRVDQPPFNDVRVRQAMRLLVNRPQMLDVVFGGHGIVANDVFAYYDPVYDHSLPQRHQDIAQAKSLLKQAGREGMTVQLITSGIAEGTVGAAQVLAQQARAADITINLRQVTSTELYGSQYLQWAFAQDYYYAQPYYPLVAFATLGRAPFNETHFNDPRYNALYAQGLATTDKAKQKEIAHEMQQIDYEQGGLIIPYFPPVVDAYSSRIGGGVQPSRTGLPFNGFDLKRIWLQ